jgi:multidrug resistance efflux pump
VEITKQQIATTKSTLQDNEQNAQISVESATNNYTNALSSKNTTLASLSNSIEQARIAYNEAQTQLGKFSVETPINGVIGEILVDV